MFPLDFFYYGNFSFTEEYNHNHYIQCSAEFYDIRYTITEMPYGFSMTATNRHPQHLFQNNEIEKKIICFLYILLPIL